MSRIDHTIQAKIEKRLALESLGVSAYPYSFNKTHTIAQAVMVKGQKAVIAGRIIQLRSHGKIVFMDLADSTGNIQVMIRLTDISETELAMLPNIDRGDFLGVMGQVDLSKTGEITLVAQYFEFLGKALRPIPSDWNTAEDKESRFRQRYLDILINDQTKKIIDTRWKTLRLVRRFLEDRHDFIEVETPVLQPLYGGTNAKPFTTYMNALDSDFYLRLAPELYLKRLVVAGYEKIFEIARNFRNEGLDQTHQPEFTMIEWYEAYADYQRMMDVAEELFRHLIAEVIGETKLLVQDHEIDISAPWPRVRMVDIVSKKLKFDFNKISNEDLKALLKTHKINLASSFTPGKALFALFDELIAPTLIDPIWIIDYPRDISPLAKAHRLDSRFAERYELYIGGKELADGWSEINDPIDQRQIFMNEQQNMRAGDTQAHPLDEDFLEAMEYGMPPLGGIGLGIDRLVMFLTNTWSIKEVIAFPTLRPLKPRSIDTSKVDSGPVNQINDALAEPAVASSLPQRAQSLALLDQHIKNAKLKHHCLMVAQAMEAYAQALNQDVELWYQAGLLHDLDWEEFPDEHPNLAIKDWLKDYPQELKLAIAAHAPVRTGRQPQAVIERYLFACDELSGIMHAVSIMRPNGFADMQASSVKKKLKDKSFAANVSRDDINLGVELIGKTADEHINFLIEVFKSILLYS